MGLVYIPEALDSGSSKPNLQNTPPEIRRRSPLSASRFAMPMRRRSHQTFGVGGPGPRLRFRKNQPLDSKPILPGARSVHEFNVVILRKMCGGSDEIRDDVSVSMNVSGYEKKKKNFSAGLVQGSASGQASSFKPVMGILFYPTPPCGNTHMCTASPPSN